MASKLFNELPCCCLVEDYVWQEVLVACHIKDEQWLCLDHAWCWRENVCLADASRVGGFRILGNPAEARPAAGDVEEAHCFWLRTDKRGNPLPPSRPGGGRPVWTTGNACRGNGHAGSRDDGSLRGPGGGRLCKHALKQITALAQKQVEGMLRPAPYLLKALALWQTLVHEMLGPVRRLRQEAEEEEAPSAPSTPTRMKHYKQRMNHYTQDLLRGGDMATVGNQMNAMQVSHVLSRPLSLRNISPTNRGNFNFGPPGPFRGNYGTLGGGHSRRRSPLDPKYQAACSAGLTSTLDKCWSMLHVQDRINFVGQAAAWAGNVMFGALNGSASNLLMHGFDGALARAFSEVSIQLAEGSREVSFCEPEKGCAMVVKALEAQLGLFEFEGDVVDRSSLTHQLSASLHSNRFTHFPEVNQMRDLRRWRKVLEMDLRASSSKAEPSPGLCKLPLVPQRCIAGFLITDWCDFAALARISHHFQELCFEAGSWAGIEARISQRTLKESGPLKSERTGLSNAAVTLLKLAGNGVGVMVDGMDAGQLAKLAVVKVAAKAGLQAFRAKLCLKGLRLYDQLSELGLEEAELEEWAESQGLQMPRQKRPKLVENDDSMRIPPLPRIPSSRLHELRLVAETSCPMLPVGPVLNGVGGSRYSLHYIEARCTGLPSCSSLVQMLGLGFRRPTAGSPNSIFQDSLDDESPRLLLFGRAPEQACRPCLPQRAPGALLVCDEEHIHLEWTPESFCNGDRIGLAAVAHRVGTRGRHPSMTGSLALVMVHNGKVIGGRWLSEERSERLRQNHKKKQGNQVKELSVQDKLVASVELPMIPGATATLLQSGAGAPALPALLEMLGRPPHMPEVEVPAPRLSGPLPPENLEEDEESSSLCLSETS